MGYLLCSMDDLVDLVVVMKMDVQGFRVFLVLVHGFLICIVILVYGVVGVFDVDLGSLWCSLDSKTIVLLCLMRFLLV